MKTNSTERSKSIERLVAMKDVDIDSRTSPNYHLALGVLQSAANTTSR